MSDMAAANGINPSSRIFFGLALANGLCGFAGGLFAQVYGFADVTMGVGTIVIGLAAVILGEAVLRGNAPSKAIGRAIWRACFRTLSLEPAVPSPLRKTWRLPRIVVDPANCSLLCKKLDEMSIAIGWLCWAWVWKIA
ncbi:hypothetical protein JQV27_20055 [Sulfitobacter mediterraneus]|nr:hypothetical protein [Sulfitobacter mediterraneus]MBM1642915.1 hypothetical protein [Sulfitobacter mediterraneus]MBM1646963.1 hypothetical protein [Sulfitobacter mediterraneus]MBM1651005.1 hypothetical protein [Sulfitobacter mediterraneus]MBM1655094.1 hypothetical protein [Sulfitobacter mediterraneus]